MPSTDLQVAPDYLVRVRKIYPGAIGVGRVTGVGHRLPGEVRRMEKRGEIVSVQRFAKEVRPGVLEIPYVRLRTIEQVRRARAIKLGLIGLGGLGAAIGVGWLAWESRYVIELFAGALLVVAGLFYLSLHWSNGCSGIHCAGCKG